MGASSTLHNYTPSDWPQEHHTVHKQENINTKSPTTAESSKVPKKFIIVAICIELNFGDMSLSFTYPPPSQTNCENLMQSPNICVHSYIST
jgi:hypothetical protein